VDRDHPAGLVAVAAGDDPVGVGRQPAVVEEDRDVVLRREQRDHVALQDEIGLDGPLDRLLYFRIGLVDDVADLLADPALPIGQGIDVGVDAGVLCVGHRDLLRR
jgi:hypothetical protein